MVSVPSVDRDKKLIFKNKKTELVSRWCRRGGAAITAGAVVASAVVEEPMPLDETSKR
jgi:hypothetical protein